MNICFISNFSKTYLFEAVGKELKNQGFGIFWIATNRKLSAHLEREFGQDHVLLINRKNCRREGRPVGEFKINELIFGDRVLRHQPKTGIQFLENIQRPVYNFLKSNNIRKVFGEITWAHEILIHRMCSRLPELECQFLNPHVVRIPDNQFGFFVDERQSQLLEIQRSKKYNWSRLSPKTPDYIAINTKILKKVSSVKGKLNRLKRFISNENIDSLDPTLLANNRIRIRQSAKEEWRREQYKSVKTSAFDPEKYGPYVYLGLHKQPEASVDVFGRYYEDQFKNIQNLWRALPRGWNLLIKEHSIAIGDRSKSFYRKIQALPNVYLIDEKTASYAMIKKAQLVATITGTMAYEAALMGIPAITFAPTFFNGLSRCRQVSLEDFNLSDLNKISKELKLQKDNVDAFSAYVHKNSFAGKVIDPVSDPAVLEPDNVMQIADAIKVVTLFQHEIKSIV